MAQQFSNAAKSTLAAALTASGTTLTLEAGTGALFPVADTNTNNWWYLTLQDGAGIEIVKVTAHAAGSVALTVVRGQQGTAARAFAVGADVGLRITADDASRWAGAADTAKEFVSVKGFWRSSDKDWSDTFKRAIAEIPAGVGLLIPPGTYDFSSTVDINRDRITIYGMGGPVLRKKPGPPMDLFTVSGNHNTLRDFEIDGNGVGWSGIMVFGMWNTITNVESHDNGALGIGLDGQHSVCSFNTVNFCYTHHNNEIGIAHHTASHSRIIGNITQDNGYEGVTIDYPSHGCVVSGNQIIGNCVRGGVGGIGCDQGILTTITGNIIGFTRSNLPGIALPNEDGDTSFCTITGNVFFDNSGGGVYLKEYVRPTGNSHATHNVISNNTFVNNGGKSIVIDPGCDNNVLSDNIYNGVWPIDKGKNNRKSGGQVYFRAANSVTRFNVTGDGTWYQVPFNVEQHDEQSCYDPTTGEFTAPVKGLYSFSAAVRVGGAQAATWGTLQLRVIGSTGLMSEAGFEMAGGWHAWPMTGETTFSLDAGDKVVCSARVGGGPKVAFVEDNVNTCYFSGYLLG